MAVSHAVRVAGGVRVALEKYDAVNWPAAQTPGVVTVKLTMLERCPSGFTTNTGYVPIFWMSSEGTVVVSRVELRNVAVAPSAWPL